jgi:hypothetical protein|nr:MAG TPA: hypothetical protein [Caudoviricetes sp.]
MSNEILQKITATFEQELKDIDFNAKTYADVNEFALAVGETLAGAFEKHIVVDPKDIIEEILNDRLLENHRLITNQGVLVQGLLNKKADIGLAVQVPEFNKSRLEGLLSRLLTEDFKDSKWLLNAPIVNFSQSIVDDMIRKNAEFHHNVGLGAKVTRKEGGNCCKWCKNLVGVYAYPDVPKDVYRRHSNCRCTVEYVPKKGVRQDVHTKKFDYTLSDLKG